MNRTIESRLGKTRTAGTDSSRLPAPEGRACPAFGLLLFLVLAGLVAAAGCGGGSGNGGRSAKTWTVMTAGDADFTSVQACIDEAVGGDTCLVYPGTYPGTVQYKGKAIKVLSSEGPEQTTLDGDYLDQDGQGDDTVVRFTDGEGQGSILDGFTITNGVAANHGGGIYVEAASPTIRNCIIRGNAAGGNGGGIYCVASSASPVIRNTVIEGNTAQGQGGALCALYGSPGLVNCLLFGNQALSGGAISARNGALLTLENCTLADNEAGESGGALFLRDSLAVATNTILWGNTAPLGGGPQAWLESIHQATQLHLRYTDLEGGRIAVPGGSSDCQSSPNLCLETGGTFLQSDPLFVPFDFDLPPDERDSKLGYYLSQSETGREDQPVDSPCVDAGDPDQILEELGLEGRTTRTDQEPDEVDDGQGLYIDLGFHYAVQPAP